MLDCRRHHGVSIDGGGARRATWQGAIRPVQRLPFVRPGAQRDRASPQRAVRPKGSDVGDFVYSPPLRRADFVWTPELLDKFLAEPQAPPFRGNRMPFAGMPDAQARADLIAYLKEATR